MKAYWEPKQGTVWWIGVCNACRMPVLVEDHGEVIYPAPLPKPTDKHVPEPIRADLDEAKTCFSVSAWRASAVMARRAMQSVAVEKGASKGKKLHEQIAELLASGKITADLKEWADVVRWVGNDGAHPNNEVVTKEDAEEVLHLSEQFLSVLYVTPGIAKNLKTRKKK